MARVSVGREAQDTLKMEVFKNSSFSVSVGSDVWRFFMTSPFPGVHEVDSSCNSRAFLLDTKSAVVESFALKVSYLALSQ